VGPDSSASPRGRQLTRIAQVVPNLPTFSVDDGFSYRVPDTLSDVQVGSLVRVPLGGRKVRGIVTHLREGDATVTLRDVLAVIGDYPVLSTSLLATMRWASIHYVAPLAALLAKALPPNIARRTNVKAMDLAPLPSPLPAVSEAAAAGRHLRPHYLIGDFESAPSAIGGLVAAVIAAGRNVAVIAPTVTETHVLAAGLERVTGTMPWVVTSSDAPARVTKAWVAAAEQPGQLLVGTRELAFWPLGELGMAVVVEEGRPAMTAPQTPTTSVRDVVRRRAATERFGLVFAGPVPTVESLAAGVAVEEPAGRVWPLVEIVDRTHEPPGTGVFTESALAAIRGVVRSDQRVFVFVTGRGDAAAFRCVRCGELRRCPNCGAAAKRGDECQRCATELAGCGACGQERFQALGAGIGRAVAELRRSVGDAVGRVGDGTPVEVGTERDLPAVRGVALAVVVDADAVVLAPHYRAEEDALRVLARVALRVERGSGKRCLIQTSQAAHRVFGALRSGRPVAFLATMLAEREAAGFPPVTQLLALEITHPPHDVDERLRAIAHDATVHGPAPIDGGLRWLVSAGDLRALKLRLRSQVQAWRDGGAKVRIDADPVRL
jgi:primosomal protein N' (replication factor Y)